MKKAGISRNHLIAGLAGTAILLHFIARFGFSLNHLFVETPLMLALLLGGVSLLYDLVLKLRRLQIGADLLAGISIITSWVLKEYLAGTIIVFMLSGGSVLESFAMGKASSVLKALAKRMPSMAHRRVGSTVTDIEMSQVQVGDALVLFPHEIAPADGIILEGHGAMDESYLTGEPFQMSKAPGSYVLSGAINGSNALVLRATKLPVDSRYAKIMEIVRSAEKEPPQIRRLGDRMGAIFTPVALLMAVATWMMTGSSTRFLAVLVIATPCPLILAIPIAIIGSISLCARRGIVVKKPAVLEQIQDCRTMIFDKTGTLTYGRPALTELLCVAEWKDENLLSLAASLEKYSRHPLAQAILETAQRKKITIQEAAQVSEKPGEGLSGMIGKHHVRIIGRKNAVGLAAESSPLPPPPAQGMESVMLIDNKYAASFRFRDEPRAEGSRFIAHLGPKHHVEKRVIVSGDRESEARYLAEKIGINEVYGGQTPEQKVAIVREFMKKGKTAFLGDGINDAPALLAATVGIAVGANSDITTEAAGVVILDNSLSKVDEFLHISRRMRRIAVESALVGMVLSAIGMGFSAAGLLLPVQGAMVQEIIDLIAIANALRASFLPSSLIDF